MSELVAALRSERERADRMAEFVAWLVSMDDHEERRVVTLATIIDRALALSEAAPAEEQT